MIMKNYNVDSLPEEIPDSEFPKIKKESLVDQVCIYLRSRIFDFVLKPGQQINESKLIKYTGVSRSPIREALRILEGEGLLERNAQRGVIVKNISIKDILETYSILSVLEGLAAEEATRRLNKDDLCKLSDLCKEMQKNARAKNYKLWSKLNHQFHKIIIKAADNSLLEDALKQYRSKTTWFMAYMANDLQEEEIFYDSENEHKEILKAFHDKKPELAATRAKSHIKNAGAKIELAYRNKIKQLE